MHYNHINECNNYILTTIGKILKIIHGIHFRNHTLIFKTITQSEILKVFH